MSLSQVPPRSIVFFHDNFLFSLKNGKSLWFVITEPFQKGILSPGLWPNQNESIRPCFYPPIRWRNCRYDLKTFLPVKRQSWPLPLFFVENEPKHFTPVRQYPHNHHLINLSDGKAASQWRMSQLLASVA